VDAEPQVFEVSIVVGDLEKALEQFRSFFGMTPYIRMDFVEEGEGDYFLRGRRVPATRVKLACFRAGPIRIELLEPVAEESIYMEFLRKKGPGVQHIGCRVSDVDKELAELKERGMEVTQRMDVAGITYAYLNTEDLAGVAFELMQSEGGLPMEE